METQDKKKKILAIDDDTFLLSMYSFKFKEKGFEVTPISSSVDALEKLRAGEFFDVILLDLMMPVMNGFDFLETIKKENLVVGSKIIVLSNLGQSPDIEKSRELGADSFIVKAASTPTQVVEKTIHALENL